MSMICRQVRHVQKLLQTSCHMFTHLLPPTDAISKREFSFHVRFIELIESEIQYLMGTARWCFSYLITFLCIMETSFENKFLFLHDEDDVALNCKCEPLKHLLAHVYHVHASNHDN